MLKKIIGYRDKFDPNNPKNFKTIKINNDYSLDVPKYMTRGTELNEEASLQYQNPLKESYVIVIDELKQEFIDALKVSGIFDESLSTLEAYVELQTQYLSENMDKPNIGEAQSIKIENLPAKVREMEAKIEGIDAYYYLTFIEGKNKMYMIMSWTLKNRKNKHKETFKKMSETFRLL